MPPPPHPNYTRRTICIAFAEGACTLPDCRFSHSMIDPARLLQLVGEVPTGSTTQTPTPDGIYLTLQYSIRDSRSLSGVWRIKLSGGGRVNLNGPGWNIDTQPAYPRETEAAVFGEALKNLELILFGHIVPVRPCSLCLRISQPDSANFTCRYLGSEGRSVGLSANSSNRENVTGETPAFIDTTCLT